MNSSMIRHVLGNILKIEGVLMVLPCLVAIVYREKEGLAFLAVAVLCEACGFLMTLRKPRSHVFYFKEGCVATAMSWILLSVFGALPFRITGEIPSYVDALFETISGFTTTGSSILTDVEALSHCTLIWRSFTHWVGGMGVLVFLLAIIPMGGGSHFHLMKAESPGPSVGKLVPKVRYTAQILYMIYIGLTAAEIILLVIGGMPLFDSVAHAFGTAGTGGFGIKADSIGGYSPYLQWVVGIFMLLFGINFNFYYYILLKNVRRAFAMEEVRGYLLIIAASTAYITYSIHKSSMAFGTSLRHAFFQVSSIITTTGFATYDFETWSKSCHVILVMLMFIGACAGSTGGGIKVSRIITMVKTVIKELQSYIHPKSIKKIKMDSRPIEHEVVRATNVFLITFLIIFVISVFLVSLDGNDLVTSFTAVAATINNIGPGLSKVGPTCNFSFFSDFAKFVMMFDMLAGRLELFPLLILLHPAIWKDLTNQKIKTVMRERTDRK
ncbi:MAG: TrkH family potassium uptake protein [Eubacterium sp.]|nr:TrkH family potassium uptake protein [Eubacterium sp.]